MSNIHVFVGGIDVTDMVTLTDDGFPYGTILKWKTKWKTGPIALDEPIGRFMSVGPSDDIKGHWEVTCVIAAPHTDWEVGLTLPVNPEELEPA